MSDPSPHHPLYRPLNFFFHVAHLVIISFTTLGWIWPPWRKAHLVLILLTLGSWYVLGFWFGQGYCPVSDWHWTVKQKLGPGRPQVSYFSYWSQKLINNPPTAENVDRFIAIGTLAITAVAVVLWAIDAS